MTVKRTTQSQQGDTLDAIAYRFFGNQSTANLPTLIEMNPALVPQALLPPNTTVYLPFNQPIAAKQQWLKIWD